MILGNTFPQNNGYQHDFLFQWLMRSKQPCNDFMQFINYPKVDCIDVKCHPLTICIRYKVCRSRPCNAVYKVIVIQHTQLILLIHDCIRDTSVCIRNLYPAHIIGDMDQSSCQARFITDWILNPSDDIGNYLIIVFFFGNAEELSSSLSKFLENRKR